jgi:hypothetical protein
MITVLQRVCWNDKFWKLPSGKTSDSGNPGKHGLGNEEWNFCKEDAFGGYVFGWLYWQVKKVAKQHMDILFWTIRPPKKEWLIVGAYHDATLATDDDLLKLHSFFTKKGVYDRRWAEAVSAVERLDHKTYVKKHPPATAKDLRFKCPVDKVEIFQPYRPYSVLPKRLQSKNARFKNPTILKESITKFLKIAAAKSQPELEYLSSPLLEDVYPRATPASLKIITPRHKALCNKFISWLDSTGRTVLGREKDRVDVEFRDGKSLCRAELKVCYGMTTTAAIREAMGQLLEYNYYGWRTPADRWFIVLDSEPSNDDVKYVRTLGTKKLLPLFLCWKSGNDFRISTLT